MNDSILPLICNCQDQTQDKSHLVETEAGAKCTSCGRVYPAERGYYDLIPDEDFYWNEFPKEQMQEFLALGHQLGWDAMIKAATADMPPNFDWLLRSNARVDSIFHGYAPERAEKCLDIGCGWGATTECLAQFYNEVWAVEPVHERLEATQIRLQEKGLHNVKQVRGFLHHLPFDDNTFDLVTVIGVLEWIPLATTEAPDMTQKKFLTEVQRVLKPGGFLLLGIENRFGAQLMLGVRDHSGLHFTSFLPRKLADWVIRLNHARKADTHVLSHDSTQTYRTYTYTHNGYQKLLRDAGFDKTDIYWTTSYQFPRYSGPFEAAAARFFLQTTTGKFRRFQGAFKFLQRAVGWIPDSLLTMLLRLFTPNFLILGFKEERPDTLQDCLLASTPNGLDNPWLKVGGADGPDGRIQYFSLNNGQPTEIAAFARFPGSAEKVAVEYDCMERFTDVNVTTQQIGDRQVWHHPYIPARESQNVDDIRRGLAWLDQWQLENSSGVWAHQAFSVYLRETLEAVQVLSTNKVQWAEATDRVMVAVDQMEPAQFIKTPEHRDFSYSNVRFAESDTASDSSILVIDWDLFQPVGWPFFDALNLIITFFAPAFNQARFDQALSNDDFHDLLAFWAEKRGVDQGLLWHLIPCYLARSVLDSHREGLLHRADAEKLLGCWLDHN